MPGGNLEGFEEVRGAGMRSVHSCSPARVDPDSYALELRPSLAGGTDCCQRIRSDRVTEIRYTFMS